ncbi:MAG TPA: GH3 auxin-responsive promoter family protein [Saprospiraceae bacterium]|nr:GH3 auxin-responsive promoter family protein [Saprospiraceae bacterium]
MSIWTSIIHTVANKAYQSEMQQAKKAVQNQEKIFQMLISKAKNTEFGKQHHFGSIQTIQDYQSRVGIGDYETNRSFFEQVKNGEKDILWPGKPKYLAKTSGTTSGTKYIPITKASIPNHINSARNALFSYLVHHKQSNAFAGKMLFLSGSPVLEKENGILIGRLSGIVNHEIPAWFQKNKLPDGKVNSEPVWEKKVDLMIQQLLSHDLRVISGIPPWIQMLLERTLEISGRESIAEVFPNLELYIHGGVNFNPYKKRLNQLLGKPITMLETYPASEGFFAYQNDPQDDGLLLLCNSGIFYEFVPFSEVNKNNPQRLTLNEVQIGVDYAIILSSNAGLWSYVIGDLVQFTSLSPYKIRVSGRVSQYISAFGEHVISSEIDHAITMAQSKFGFQLTEYSVAPQVNPLEGELPYHEWFIEFKTAPSNLDEIAQEINKQLIQKNTYYKDLITNQILQNLKIRVVKTDGFKNYLISIGKYGEQFKVPRLSNDRKHADSLMQYTL